MEEAIGQALGMKAAELRRAFRDEVDPLRRQVAQLRAEFDADRNLKALHKEIEDARRDVPRLPDVEARFAAKQAEAKREIASLKKELAATRERLTLVHTELGQVRYQVGKSPKPAVTVTLNTPESSFIVRDDDPAASAAWQRFVENVVESNPDATAQIEGRVNGTAKN